MAVDGPQHSRGDHSPQPADQFDELDPLAALTALSNRQLDYLNRARRPLGLSGIARYSDGRLGISSRQETLLPTVEGDDAAVVRLRTTQRPAPDAIAVFTNLPQRVVTAREQTARRVQAIASEAPGLTVAAGRPLLRPSDGTIDDRIEVSTADGRFITIVLPQQADVPAASLAALAVAARDVSNRFPGFALAPIVVTDVASVEWDDVGKAIRFPVSMLADQPASAIAYETGRAAWFSVEDQLYAADSVAWSSLTYDLLRAAGNDCGVRLPHNIDPPWSPESAYFRSQYSNRYDRELPVEFSRATFGDEANSAVVARFGDTARDPRSLLAVVFAQHIDGRTDSEATQTFASEIRRAMQRLAHGSARRYSGRAERVRHEDLLSDHTVQRAERTMQRDRTDDRIPPWRRYAEQNNASGGPSTDQSGLQPDTEANRQRWTETFLRPRVGEATRRIAAPLPYPLNHGVDQIEANRAQGRLPHRPDHARFGTAVPLEWRCITDVGQSAKTSDGAATTAWAIIAIADGSPLPDVSAYQRATRPEPTQLARLKLSMTDSNHAQLQTERVLHIEAWTSDLPRNAALTDRLVDVVIGRAVLAGVDRVVLDTSDPMLRGTLARRGAVPTDPAAFVGALFRPADNKSVPLVSTVLRTALREAGVDISAEKKVRSAAIAQLNAALLDARLVPHRHAVMGGHGPGPAFPIEVPITKPISVGRRGDLRWTKFGHGTTAQEAFTAFTPDRIIDAMVVNIGGKQVDVGRAFVQAVQWSASLAIDKSSANEIVLPENDRITVAAAQRALAEVELLWPEAAQVNERLGASYDPVFAATWWHTPSGDDQVIPLERIDVSVGRRRVLQLVSELEAR